LEHPLPVAVQLAFLESELSVLMSHRKDMETGLQDEVDHN